MKPIILYGAGCYGKYYLDYLKRRGIKPLCFVDKDKSKWGTKIEGIAVISLERAIDLYENFHILITPICPLREEIKRELMEKEGIHEKDIINAITDNNDIYQNFCLSSLLIFSPSNTKIENECPTSSYLSKRISLMYQELYNVSMGDGMWEIINNRKHDVHKALLKGDVEFISKMLSNPGDTNLFFGFDAVYCNEQADMNNEIMNTEMVMLHKIGEIWGVSRIINPELNQLNYTDGILLSYVDIDYIIERLNHLFGCDIEFPNPYLGERGVEVTTSAGLQVASFRALQALHQSFLIWDRLGRKPGKVVEIGAGLGRTAYYCKKLFHIDYIIVDLVMTQVASAHFLAQTLGEKSICLFGESYIEEQIKFLSPHEFLLQQGEKYDLIVNFDSLTEMDYSTMKKYWDKIKVSTYAFLSVNHEVNEHTVNELIWDDPFVKSYKRRLYEMRAGYAEEYVTF